METGINFFVSKLKEQRSWAQKPPKTKRSKTQFRRTVVERLPKGICLMGDPEEEETYRVVDGIIEIWNDEEMKKKL